MNPLNILNPKEWVANYSDELFRFALMRVSNEETARDLLQETYLSALRNLETFKGEISEKNWLYFILKNKIIDHYRKNSRTNITRIEDEPDDDEFFTESGHWKKDALPKYFNLTSAEHHHPIELNEIIELCKRKLNEIQLRIFGLKFLDEIEAEEICKEMKISSSNYWVIIHRIKLKIRKCLEKLLYGKNN